MEKNNSVCKENGSNVFRKEREQYHEIQDLKAQMQDKNIAISELKKLIEMFKRKGVDTNFEQPSILGKPPVQSIRNQPVCQNGFTKDELHEMASAENNTSGLVPQWKRRLIAADQASVFMEMASIHISSGLVLHQITSDHNRSELGIHDHNNEPSSSKLVPKVVPLAVKTATSRQELELLFHHHIAMLRTTGINPMIQPEPEDLPKDNPKLEIAVLRFTSLFITETYAISLVIFARTSEVILMYTTMKMEILLSKHQTTLVAPPSPDYIPGPEDPQTPPVPQDEDEREPMFVQAHDPDYVPEPVYPEYIPLEDEHVFPAEEQPLPPVDSPTAESPGYITESDPEEDPEEYEDDETEDGPVDYPMDGGDDGDDDDGDSSGDDADDEDEEEEEEHLAPADSTIVVPTDEPVSPPEGTEPAIPPPSTDITIGARITVRPQASISLPPEAEVERLLAMTTPSPSPPISLSPPSAGERLARCTAPPAHSSPPPVPSPLLPSSGCPTQIQTLRIASTQALIDAVTAALPSPPLPPLPSSLYISPPIDRRDDVPETELPPRKRLCLSTLGSRYEIGESSTARPTGGRGIDYGFVSTVDAEERRQGVRDVGYGIRDTWVDPAEAVPEVAPMTVGEVNTRVTELVELHEHDTQDLYALLEDAQDSRSRISQRVDMDSQARVDLPLMWEGMTLQETVWMVEEEAYASREAWAHSIGLSQATHQELQTHRDHVYAHETHIQAHQAQLQLQSTLIQTQHQVYETRFQMQQAEIAALRESDRRRQAQMAETLRVMRDMR
ncbi:hypothetical protein Tco_0568684 [Tanacetum coccineum]